MMSVRLATPRLAIEKMTTLFRNDFIRGTTATNYDVFPDRQRFVMVRDRGVVTSGLPVIVMLNWPALRPKQK